MLPGYLVRKLDKFWCANNPHVRSSIVLSEQTVLCVVETYKMLAVMCTSRAKQKVNDIIGAPGNTTVGPRKDTAD